MTTTQSAGSDFDRIEAALAGSEAAAASIRSREATAKLEGILVNRGASPTEACDLVADLWADCFAGKGKRPPLLEQFNGRGSLDAFLTRSALNRLIDFKRRQRFQGQLPGRGEGDGDREEDAFDRLPGDAIVSPDEDSLVDLLRNALLHTFARCDPEQLLILRLVQMHGIGQERVARMWGWSQSKVSRSVTALVNQIRSETLREIRRVDPWLELEWDDFVKLCHSSSLIFRAD